MKKLVLSVFLIALPMTATAKDMGNQSFNDAMALYESMTPEQKKAVMKAAKGYEKQLKAMSPEERDALVKQNQEVGDSLKINQIDPAKLKTDKIAKFDDNIDNLEEYEKKRKAGKIKNSAVK